MLDHQSTIHNPELTPTRSFQGAITESERTSLEENIFMHSLYLSLHAATPS
jgi:hypothetical protein